MDIHKELEDTFIRAKFKHDKFPIILLLVRKMMKSAKDKNYSAEFLIVLIPMMKSINCDNYKDVNREFDEYLESL